MSIIFIIAGILSVIIVACLLGIYWLAVHAEIDTNLPDKIPYPKCLRFSDGTFSIVDLDCDGGSANTSWLLKKGYHIDAAGNFACGYCSWKNDLVLMSR